MKRFDTQKKADRTGSNHKNSLAVFSFSKRASNWYSSVHKKAASLWASGSLGLPIFYLFSTPRWYMLVLAVRFQVSE